MNILFALLEGKNSGMCAGIKVQDILLTNAFNYQFIEIR
jgi:hypothetical protein